MKCIMPACCIPYSVHIKSETRRQLLFNCNFLLFALSLTVKRNVCKVGRRKFFTSVDNALFTVCAIIGERSLLILLHFSKKKSLTWANCVAVCTDGVAALTGSNKGLRDLIQKVAPRTVFNHCMILRQALVAKDMDEELHNILQDAVNYIKCNSLNSRLFSILCNEMGSTYERLTVTHRSQMAFTWENTTTDI
ncbi:UNVERIFIED_CONTAM: zinc finger MYM-type protein 6 [Trichonephila clavipes]